MRIAHVVTLLSADGSYGGPVSVAVAQCAELARRGHHVTLLAGWDGRADAPRGFESRRFQVRQLLPGGAFSTLASLRMVVHVARHAREWDVVHVHLARDLVVVPAALICRWRGIPVVVQSHGTIGPDRRPRYRIFDRVAVRRILRGAHAQLVLTPDERERVLLVAPGCENVAALANGVPASLLRAHPAEESLPDVVFCARLHPRKRVLAFADMAALLIARGTRARFTVIGPDGGDLAALQQRLQDPAFAGLLTYEGALAPVDVPQRLAQAQILVLPSSAEPFPMAVLEAWSVGLPAVLTRSNGLAPTLSAADPRLVVDGSVESLADAVELVLDEATWSQSAGRAVALADGRFGIAGVVTELEQVYGCRPRTSTTHAAILSAAPSTVG